MNNAETSAQSNPSTSGDRYLDKYDVVVIGSGLAGMTAANVLGRGGHKVLLLERHYKLGGLATWFRREKEVIWIDKNDFDHDDELILKEMIKIYEQ